jgi:serine/threonine protein phosphatase 1
MVTLRWRASAVAPSDLPRYTPADTLVFAVGDIHGRIDLLDTLLLGIGSHAQQHPQCSVVVIFLGDYLSRGQDSRGVVERVMHWRPALAQPCRVVALKGNHEDLALRYLAGDLEAGKHWFDYDGLDALRDYGVNPCDKASLAAMRDAFTTALPLTHLAFLKSLAVSHREQDYHFVHAGVRPGVVLAEQADEDQMWIRTRFLESEAEHGAIVVHGHTVSPEPQERANRIGIDTGAYASGVLTCLVLEGNQHRFLQAVGPPKRQAPSAADTQSSQE